MNNILFIGPYRQQPDGWSLSAIDYIRSLAKTGNNLAIRPIYMTSQNGISCDIDLLQYENNKFDNYDVVIQNTLPNYFTYDGRFKKNVGLFYSETGGLEHTDWINKCNLLDEIWVPTTTELVNLKESGVKVPIYIVPIPCDIKKFQQSYDKLSIPTITDNTFVFYFIGEFIERKNMGALLKAFHTEFTPHEDVALLIKTNKSGYSSERLADEIVKFSAEIKKSLRLYPKLEDYKSEIIITDRLEEEKLWRLHKSCHCFVMPSHGESWNRPCMDALGFGNPVIVTEFIGPSDYVGMRTKNIESPNGYTINSMRTPTITQEPPMLGLYTGKEYWEEPSISDLAKLMRHCYKLYREKKELWGLLQEKALETPYNYTYEEVAKKMETLL